MKTNVIKFLTLTFILGLPLFMPEAYAQYMGGGFESKVTNLSNALISQILPLMSICGIVYASMLAMNGSPEAKSRITLVIGCSIVGFLAPYIIAWIKAFAS